jgi:N-acetylneuraminate lyase
MSASAESVGSPASGAAGLAGLHAALLTPYGTDGEVSVGCLRRLVAHVGQLGVDGYYVGGSSGEALLQSTDERRAVLEVVADAGRGKTLIAHVGAVATRDARQLAKASRELGYHAVSAIPPIYYPHRKDAIFGYYEDILEAAGGTPLILYNIPAMSGVTFTLDDLARLLSLPNVAGIKQTSIDMYQMEQLRRGFPDAVILNGYDEMLLAGLASGADGAIGSTFNLLGDRYAALAQHLRAGEVGAAGAVQSACNVIIDELIRVGVFAGLKYMAHRLGIIATPACRKPLATLSAGTAGRLDEFVRALGGAA